MEYLQTRWIDSFCDGEPLTPTYGLALVKYEKYSSAKSLSSQLMKEREVKKARAEQERMRRKSGGNQHVQKNGVIYKGTAVRQIEERKQEVVNRASVRLCKAKDKVWKNLVKELPAFELSEIPVWLPELASAAIAGTEFLYISPIFSDSSANFPVYPRSCIENQSKITISVG
jgi:hypothetical protein